MACADIFDKMRASGIGKRTVEQAKKIWGLYPINREINGIGS